MWVSKVFIYVTNVLLAHNNHGGDATWLHPVVSRDTQEATPTRATELRLSGVELRGLPGPHTLSPKLPKPYRP